MNTSPGNKFSWANRTSILALALGLTILPLHPASAQPGTRSRIETFPVGAYANAMAFDGTNIWVTSYQDTSVTELRASDGSLVRTVPVGGENIAIAFDGTYVWVVVDGLTFTGLTRLRAADGTVEGSYSLGNHYLNNILYDGENIWVCTIDSLLFKLRASDATVLGRQTLNSETSYSLSMAFDGTNVWVTNALLNSVTKVRARDGIIVGTYDTGEFPFGIAFDGAHMWIANNRDGTLSLLRARDGALLATIPVTQSPVDVKFDGQHIWVSSDGGADSVQRLGARTRLIQRTYPIGAFAEGLLFDGQSMWVAEWSDPGFVTKLSPRP
jgi:outer membrane protein assembly factor BamB